MSTYKDRYKSVDDGLRFQDLVYQGNFKGMDPVPDGILGDKILRQRAKSNVFRKSKQGGRAQGSIHCRRIE
jgi:hypothetical protein